MACSVEPEIEKVATVGDLYISKEEFELTYQFNPHLSQIKNPTTAKYLLLRTLIAQKIIVQENYDKNQHENPQIKELIDQFEREALIEKLWQAEISDQINISEEEIYNAYIKSKKKRIYQYLIFKDIQQAENAYQQMQEGYNFSRVAQLHGIDPEIIPTDSISFGSDLDVLEDHIFQMSINQISKPLKTGQYYLIVKLINEKHNIFTSENDFQKEYKRLVKSLRKRKQREYFQDYIKSNIDRPPYHLDRKVFKRMIQEMERIIDFKSKSKISPQQPLINRAYYEAVNRMDDIKDEQVVNFDSDEPWTVRTLLTRIEVSPYPIELTSPGKFRSSMIAATKMTLDDGILVRLARKSNLDQSDYVKAQKQMWQDQIIYKKVLGKFIRMSSISDSSNQMPMYKLDEKSLDSFLTNAAEKYEVTVFSDVLDTLTLSKSDMVVMKTHFPERTIGPVIQPLMNLPEFKKALSGKISDE
jgi:hypothetical protein